MGKVTSSEASKEENGLAMGQPWEFRFQEYQPQLISDTVERTFSSLGEFGGAPGETGRDTCGDRKKTIL